MKRARLAAPVATLLVLALAPVLGIAAALAAPTTAPPPPGGLDDKIKSAREQVAEASAEEARLLEKIDASASRKKQLEATVGTLENQVQAVEGEVAAAESRLAAVEAEEARTEHRLVETQAQLTVAKAALVRQAIAAYTGKTEAVRFIDVTVKAHDIGELIAKREYIKAVTTNQTEVIATHQRLRDQVEDLREDLGRARVDAETQRDVVAGKRTALQIQRDAQTAAKVEVEAEINQGSQLRGEALARKKEFQAEVDALQRESDMIAAALRARPSTPDPGGASGNGSSTPSPSGGVLSSPLPGAAIVSGFGPRVHPIYGDVRPHTGVDYAASEGTPIRAAGDGVVVSAGSYGGYGNATVIDHGGGIATLYGHQSSMGVGNGGRVTRGQVIGRVGCTGACTGPHLHFEVRLKGTPVNPMSYL